VKEKQANKQLLSEILYLDIPPTQSKLDCFSSSGGKEPSAQQLFKINTQMRIIAKEKHHTFGISPQPPLVVGR